MNEKEDQEAELQRPEKEEDWAGTLWEKWPGSGEVMATEEEWKEAHPEPGTPEWYERSKKWVLDLDAGDGVLLPAGNESAPWDAKDIIEFREYLKQEGWTPDEFKAMGLVREWVDDYPFLKEL